MITSLSLQALGFDDASPLTVARVAKAGRFGGGHLRLDLADRTERESLTDLVAGGMFLPTWVFPLDGLFADAIDDSRRWERAFRATAPFAVDLGVSVVCSDLPTVVTSPPAGSSGIRAAGLVHRLQRAAGVARDAGLTLGVSYDPHGRIPGSLAGMIDLLDSLGLGLVADATHLTDAGTLEPVRWVERVVDVHLTDPAPCDLATCDRGTTRPGVTGRRRTRRQPAETGPVDHARLLQALATAGYRGPVMLDSLADPGVSPGVAAARARALLAGFLADITDDHHTAVTPTFPSVPASAGHGTAARLAGSSR